MGATSVKKVLLAAPRGFCAGVGRAIQAVEDTLEIFGSPIYVKHEIVHNKHVVADLAAKGVITIENLSEAPDGAVVVFSAHGSLPEHYTEAKRRHMRLIDATCPLVTKVHLEVQRFLKDGYTVVYIGHHGHVEGIGVLGEAGSTVIPLVETAEEVEKLEIGNPEKLIYLTQTTLSVDDTADVIAALKKKYPQIVAPPLSDICFATTNRQEAVKALAKLSDLILIFGSKNSSNSTRLKETARAAGVQAYLIDDISELDENWLIDVETVGISAGASVPEKLVEEAVAYFASLGVVAEDFVVKLETMTFSEPLDLMQLKKNR
ncbi:MAG: 4-hydroxy-3-methylbut-2-enyl diphosphate reductase [Candidatus Moranbacteria bacterium]|nr:4-hydroxy-3-methylbut-2-enyl diphosphate reductase [Candidatus Moranbacteria bacterium]